jgi:gamma-tubulin complex component 3
LVRDLIYTFQGVDGSYIKYDAQSDSYQVDAEVATIDSLRSSNIRLLSSFLMLCILSQAGVSRSHRELCARIAELGWLYRRVCQHINLVMEHNGTIGLVEQV